MHSFRNGLYILPYRYVIYAVFSSIIWKQFDMLVACMNKRVKLRRSQKKIETIFIRSESSITQ